MVKDLHSFGVLLDPLKTIAALAPIGNMPVAAGLADADGRNPEQHQNYDLKISGAGPIEADQQHPLAFRARVWGS
jgi:hypothetical protein